MGFLSFFGLGSKNKVAKLEKKIKAAEGKVRIAGLKGQSLPILSSTITTVRFKRVQKREKTLAQEIDELQKAVKEHHVVDAEDDELKAIQLISAEYATLYLTLNKVLRFELEDLKKFEELVSRVEILCKKKGIDEFTRKHIADMFRQVAKEWGEDIAELRKMINSVFQSSKGGEGWALSLFNKMRNEGFFIRYQERKHFREALKDEKKVEKALSKVKDMSNVRSLEELKALVESVKAEEHEMANDFSVVEKALLNTWNNITALMVKLLSVTTTAINAHELPQKLLDDMNMLHNLIVNNLEKDFLESLRIEDKQLEGEESEVDKAIDRLAA